MQTRLQALASDYNFLHGRLLYVLKAWASFPDGDIHIGDNSLHYEGEVIIFKDILHIYIHMHVTL